MVRVNYCDMGRVPYGNEEPTFGIQIADVGVSGPRRHARPSDGSNAIFGYFVFCNAMQSASTYEPLKQDGICVTGSAFTLYYLGNQKLNGYIVVRLGGLI